jgi:hypothetical protein
VPSPAGASDLPRLPPVVGLGSVSASKNPAGGADDDGTDAGRGGGGGITDDPPGAKVESPVLCVFAGRP